MNRRAGLSTRCRRTPFAPLLLVLALAVAPSLCGAAEEKPSPSKAQLAREFNDPLTVVPQLAIQNAYTPSAELLRPG